MTLLHRLASVLDWILRRDRAEQRLDDELQAFVEMSAAEKMRDGLSAGRGAPPGDARARRRRAGQGTRPHLSPRRLARRDRPRRALRLPHVRQEPRLHRRRRADAGARHRRQHGDLQPDRRADAAVAAGARIRRSWCRSRSRPPSPKELRATSFSYAIVRALAEQREIFAGVGRLQRLQLRRRRARCRSVACPARSSPAATTRRSACSRSPAVCSRREDDEPGAPLVAVISDGYWERQFARSAGAVGQTIQINGVPVTIVGVSPRGFVGANVGSIADITMAVAALPQVNPSAAPLLGPGNFWLRVLARPQPGVSGFAGDRAPQRGLAADRRRGDCAALAGLAGERRWPSRCSS